jgi:hypothetical protein
MVVSDGVQQYIDVKKNVLRNMERIQNELVELQFSYPSILSAHPRLRKIQMVLDDPFAADGLPSSP